MVSYYYITPKRKNWLIVDVRKHECKLYFELRDIPCVPQFQLESE